MVEYQYCLCLVQISKYFYQKYKTHSTKNTKNPSQNNFLQQLSQIQTIQQVSLMMFFSHKIKFKKQSESLGLNLNDKEIRKGKGQLIQLTKKHQQVDEDLKHKKNQFETLKNKLFSQHQYLVNQQKKHKLRILKLQVRKDQLMARQNQNIRNQKAQILKKYLKCMSYTIGDKFETIRSMKRPSVYEFMRSKVLNLELRLYTKNKMKQVVFMKKMDFQDDKIMFMIKQKEASQGSQLNFENQNTSSKSRTSKSIFNLSKFNPDSSCQFNSKHYEFRIFAINGKAFQMVKVYSQKQLQGFIDKLNNQKRSETFGTLTTVKKTPKQSSKKQRLSLQFNSVFKKGLEGFFNKRSSQTSNDPEGKLVNIDQLIKSSNRDSKYKIQSDRSKLSHKNSIRQSQQHRSNSNSVRSQVSHSEQSRGNSSVSKRRTNKKVRPVDAYLTKTNPIQTSEVIQNVARCHNQLPNKPLSRHAQNSENTNQQVFPQQQISQNQVKLNRIQTKENNLANNNDESDASYNNTSKLNSIATDTGLVRSFIEGQNFLVPGHNCLLNIVILKDKKQFYILPEYLQNKQNFDKINLCVKKYQFKIQLQKELRKTLFHKVLKMNSFFQTENRSMQPFSLQLLFTIKYAKDDVYIPKVQEFKQNLKAGKQTQPHHSYLKDRKSKVFNLTRQGKGYNNQDIVISCENIRCETKEKTFLIHKILKEQMLYDANNRVLNMISNVNKANNRMRSRGEPIQAKKRLLQNSNKENQKNKQERRRKKKKTLKNEENNDDQLKQQEERKHILFREKISQMFQELVQNNWLSIKQYKFIKKIDFSKKIGQIIMIQKNIKASYYRKLYKQKKKNPLIYKFQPTSKILITAILDLATKNISIFIQCLVVRLNQKYKSKPLSFKQCYWATISAALSNLVRLSDSVIQVRDEFQKYLHKKIRTFQQEQARLQALKPELYLTRLRKFFINIMLRVKAKKNIMFLKKLYHNSQTYVLIVRKSKILKSVCHANIYYLQQYVQKGRNKQNLKQNSEDQLEQNDKTIKNTTKQLKKKKKRQRYQTINLLVEYFSSIPHSKVADEFHFDSEHFLLKPPKNHSVHYIQRLLTIDINSEEIGKEITLIQWQQPSKKKKNDQNPDFISNQLLRDSILYLNKAKQGHVTPTQACQTLKQKSAHKRKNASIMVPNESQQDNFYEQNKLLFRQQKVQKQRRSFRISIRNNCIVKGVQKGKHSGNSPKAANGVNIFASSKNKQPSSKRTSTVQRLSRQSLFEPFTNQSSSKKVQYQIKGNSHGKVLYYSLVKIEEVFYEMQIYVVKRKYLLLAGQNYEANTQMSLLDREDSNNQMNNLHKFPEEGLLGKDLPSLDRKKFNDQLLLVYKQNLSKKELIEANWTLIYHKIARWIKNNLHLLVLVEMNNSA